MQLPIGPQFVVMGIDQSLSGTGLAVVNAVKDLREWSHSATAFLSALRTEVLLTRTVDTSSSKGMPRLATIVNAVLETATHYAPSLICMEDVTRMATSAAIIPLTELYAVIKFELWRKGYAVRVQNQSSMKKFAFGQGDVSKDSNYMLRVFDVTDLRFFDDNQADAYMHAILGINTIWLLRGDKKLEDFTAKKQEVLLASAMKESSLTQGKFKKLSYEDKLKLVLEHAALT